MKTKWVFLAFLGLAGLTSGQAEGSERSVAVNQETIGKQELTIFGPWTTIPWIQECWLYHPGNEPGWASRDLDDSRWKQLDPNPEPWMVPPDIAWNGHAWFRLNLDVAEDVAGIPLSLMVYQFGASEMYLDGRLLTAIGQVGTTPESEQSYLSTPGRPHLVALTFDRPGPHVLAIRYSNFWALRHQHLDAASWFGVALFDPQMATGYIVDQAKYVTIIQGFFTGVPFAVTLLHLFLFLFNRGARENLYYALFTASATALVFEPFELWSQTDPDSFLLCHMAFKFALILTAWTGIRFLHYSFYGRTSRYVRVLNMVAIFVLLLTWWLPLSMVFIFTVAAFPEMIRLTAIGIRRRLEGARIIGMGVGIFILGCTYQVLMELNILPPNLWFAFVYGILGMVVCMSIHLARRFGQINQDLSHQLVQVRDLSERAVEQERLAADQELARQELEAENALKTKELEEARKRQQILDELERTNKELRDTQTKLVQSEKMASLGSLVAGVAHEINTPVGAINSMHDTLVRAVERLKISLESRDFGDDRDVAMSMQVIADANRVIATGTERVTEIVRSLRSFARLDEAEMKEADLHEGLENTLTLIRHDMKGRVEVVKDYGDIPRIVCFPSRLNQVFLNLLVNASQAIEGGGTVTIRTDAVDGNVRIAISDTGAGIPEDRITRIFDPGYTTKGVGVGTGLGLSICYQIVNDHNGEILVDSVVGEGTTFTIVLPTNLEEE